MQITADFVISASGAGDFPRDQLPEVALVGRSNVGKSSLINALVRQPVARTSAAPGKTRLANFYRVSAEKRPAFYLVDLPGYGYARGGDAAAREFRRLGESYFSGGASLSGSPGGPEGSAPPIKKKKAAILLVDSRHPGLDSDLSAWDWLQSQPIAQAVVATKVDKLTRAERVRHSKQLDSVFNGPVMLVSAYTGEGLEELWKLIVRLANRTETAP